MLMTAIKYCEEDSRPVEYGQCLICGADIDPKAITFEQRLIGDEDFCGECFTEIMIDSEGETLVLPKLEFSQSGHMH